MPRDGGLTHHDRTSLMTGGVTLSQSERLMAAIIEDRRPAWPASVEGLAAAFLEESAYHGVQPLLHGRLGSTPWPSEVRGPLRKAARSFAIWELSHRQVVQDALAALAEIGAEPILIKGTALAHGLYPKPELRVRADTDLIVPPHARKDAEAVLAAAGFSRAMGVSGDVIAYQASYRRQTAQAGIHSLDLHWRINNSELLSGLFSHEELGRHSVPLPTLGPHARTVSPVHALLLACMHRGAHKQIPYRVEGVTRCGGDRLIWLYDIHLLSESLAPEEWGAFLQGTKDKGLAATCLEGIARATDCFDTKVPAFVLNALRSAGAEAPPARYMDGSRMLRQWMDFRAIGTPARQLQFVRELMFPPEPYMRHKYAATQATWLPWLYLRRTIGGLRKALRA